MGSAVKLCERLGRVSFTHVVTPLPGLRPDVSTVLGPGDRGVNGKGGSCPHGGDEDGEPQLKS